MSARSLRPQESRCQNDRQRRTPHLTVGGELPFLLTADDLAEILRTSRKAVYTMIERGLVPGVVRFGRRVLIRRDSLIDLICQESTPSQEGRER